MDADNPGGCRKRAAPLIEVEVALKEQGWGMMHAHSMYFVVVSFKSNVETEQVPPQSTPRKDESQTAEATHKYLDSHFVLRVEAAHPKEDKKWREKWRGKWVGK
ncbi:hypothetical protein M407DRAFT_10188 [Tulasnella calospora MUT 4182]|uniref:Uncharacterized protein n=1 Tax=Tulasnella calospora MUT 4182 TaxID=1051891 RepID=A0A0C3QAJ8_9AGAM|nr:hypothetical protein M407DRAFT_10188 [Tulasnella calospora MUT 4182]